MLKKLAFITVVLSLALIFIGNYFYNEKIQATTVKAKDEFAKQALLDEREQKRIEEEKAKEAKRVFEKNKGVPLTYIPMGDSISAGFASTKPELKFTSVLSKKIEETLGYDVELITDYAISGSGLKDNGLLNVEEVVKQKPDFVTVAFGTNDLNEKMGNAFAEPDEFKESLLNVITELQEGTPNTKILLVTTWSFGDLSYQYDSIISEIGEMRKVQVANIQAAWVNRSDTAGPKGSKVGTIESDGWHPNDQGHKEIANLVFKKTYDLLK